MSITDEALQRAYASYDSDHRVGGPEDYDAFSQAIRDAISVPNPVRDDLRRGPMASVLTWIENELEAYHSTHADLDGPNLVRINPINHRQLKEEAMSRMNLDVLRPLILGSVAREQRYAYMVGACLLETLFGKVVVAGDHVVPKNRIVLDYHDMEIA